MEMQSLQDLFLDELRDVLHAENQILKALPRMKKAASSPDLQSAFQEHIVQTQGQIERLGRVFEAFGEKPKAKPCKAMQGIIEEGKEMMEEVGDDDVMDATLIGSAQKVEHYEIASYGTLRTYAQLLGNDEAARLLQETLDEEKETDQKLTALAENGINVEAMEPGEQGEDAKTPAATRGRAKARTGAARPAGRAKARGAARK